MSLWLLWLWLLWSQKIWGVSQPSLWSECLGNISVMFRLFLFAGGGTGGWSFRLGRWAMPALSDLSGHAIQTLGGCVRCCTTPLRCQFVLQVLRTRRLG
jgi:hypothetical protein